MESACTKSELVEHRHHLIRERDRLRNRIERALTELLEIRDASGDRVLGDVKADHGEMEWYCPNRLDAADKRCLARAIEILREVDE